MSGRAIETERQRLKEAHNGGKATNPYIPNEVHWVERLTLLILIIVWSAQALQGFLTKRIWGFGKRTDGVMYVGPSAGLMGVALVAYASSALFRILDHYDQRNNESTYRFLSSAMLWLAIGFHSLAGVWLIFGSGAQPRSLPPMENRVIKQPREMSQRRHAGSSPRTFAESIRKTPPSPAWTGRENGTPQRQP